MTFKSQCRASVDLRLCPKHSRISLDLTSRGNRQPVQSNASKVNSVSSRHRLACKERIREHVGCPTERFAIPVTTRSRQTSIGRTTGATVDDAMRPIAKRDVCTIDQTAACLSRIKLDPQLGASCARFTHGSAIAHIVRAHRWFGWSASVINKLSMWIPERPVISIIGVAYLSQCVLVFVFFTENGQLHTEKKDWLN